MYKIIIAGSRSFNNYDFLVKTLDKKFEKVDKSKIEIVSGTARGADKLGERYAEENNLQLKQFPADWDKHGKSAGYIRNEQMAKYATHCILFWDGVSKGTKHMKDLCVKHNVKHVVITTTT